LLGKWDDHYRSWTKNKENLLIIKYEDLILKPKEEIKKLISYLKKYVDFSYNEKKIDNILQTTSFDNLKKMENEKSFEESPHDIRIDNKKKFFNLGPDNRWDVLNTEIKEKIEKQFYKEMLELGYVN
ncbi:sulfotransferase domain-containing protein, partial [Candidatus Pelagibacter communis]|uniref:sulfotransferase domain-containing protein n=1 Tax=Pelagibacter ubique TaxID=198252 RepID=UPI000AD9BE30